MNMKKTAVAAAVTATLGVAAAPMTASAAGLIADGNYNMVIQQTPTYLYMGVVYNSIGSDGAWNSSFTFGQLPGTGSQPMTDNGTVVTGSDSVIRGSGVLQGDSITAGQIGITVSGNAITTSSFEMDAIFATAGGTFVQYTGDATTMVGTVDGVGMTFQPNDRLGAISAPNGFFNNPWNLNDADASTCSSTTGCLSNGVTTYDTFTTGASTGPAGTANGAAPVNIGDVNGDSIDDYSAILVVSTAVGSNWGGFGSVPFVETWNVQILSQAAAVVPVPAAVWLFGSGLLGLVGVARRKKQA